MPELSQADAERNPFMEKLDPAALEPAFDDALIEGQAFALERFLAEDWTVIDLFGGLMDKSSLDFHSIVTEEIRARIYHQSAVVTGCAAVYYEFGGDFSCPKKNHLIDGWSAPNLPSASA